MSVSGAATARSPGCCVGRVVGRECVAVSCDALFCLKVCPTNIYRYTHTHIYTAVTYVCTYIFIQAAKLTVHPVVQKCFGMSLYLLVVISINDYVSYLAVGVALQQEAGLSSSVLIS